MWWTWEGIGWDAGHEMDHRNPPLPQPFGPNGCYEKYSTSL